MIQRGYDVIADRGFLIRDLLTLRWASLNIHGRHMSKVAVKKTRRIVAVQIYVERAVGSSEAVSACC